MGYWKHATASTTMGDACRDLLSAVLSQAGFSQELDKAEEEKGVRRTKCLIDLGVGCGDQSIYLLNNLPVRQSDAVWWDARKHCIKFDHYIGITNDVTQAQYASERLAELQSTWHEMEKPGAEGTESSNPLLFCADAARPENWNEKLQASIQHSHSKTQERWVLALDTAYHFAPSRWHLIKHIHQNFKASFMAFDLCISPTATNTQRLILRGLTTMMGAPWHNFTTPEDYCAKFVQVGYHTDDITIKDVSEHVFTPLADYLDGQDRRLAVLGLSIGAFGVVKKMFAWWGRTGVVRGIVVVARFDEGKSHEPV
ncbi:hypothetical protein J1614_010115 [Plenodomus biglobosus]|nr:hypothetical protein J1614_010115 [Plenodomus biglobosus]